MKLPYALRAWVELRKARDYLLNLEHPEGADKAAFFLGHGFQREHWETFAEAMLFHAWTGDAEFSKLYETEELWVVVGPLDCPSGKRPLVQSVWGIQNNRPRLITAYPR